MAVRALWTHPIGSEARGTVEGKLLRSEAKRDRLALFDEALAWKQQFSEKGWE